jgi:hypothetical protein
MRQPRGRDDAGGLAAFGGVFQDRLHRLAVDDAGVAFAARGGVVHREHAFARLVAGGHRRHRRRRVGGLLVPRVGLRERGVRVVLERQAVLLTGLAVHLPFEDARRGDGGNAHAVADEQDHVLGLAVVALHAIDALAVAHEALAGPVPIRHRFRALHHRCGLRMRANGAEQGDRGGDHGDERRLGHVRFLAQTLLICSAVSARYVSAR